MVQEKDIDENEEEDDLIHSLKLGDLFFYELGNSDVLFSITFINFPNYTVDLESINTEDSMEPIVLRNVPIDTLKPLFASYKNIVRYYEDIIKSISANFEHGKCKFEIGDVVKTVEGYDLDEIIRGTVNNIFTRMDNGFDILVKKQNSYLSFITIITIHSNFLEKIESGIYLDNDYIAQVGDMVKTTDLHNENLDNNLTFMFSLGEVLSIDSDGYCYFDFVDRIHQTHLVKVSDDKNIEMSAIAANEDKELPTIELGENPNHKEPLKYKAVTEIKVKSDKFHKDVVEPLAKTIEEEDIQDMKDADAQMEFEINQEKLENDEHRPGIHITDDPAKNTLELEKTALTGMVEYLVESNMVKIFTPLIEQSERMEKMLAELKHDMKIKPATESINSALENLNVKPIKSSDVVLYLKSFDTNVRRLKFIESITDDFCLDCGKERENRIIAFVRTNHGDHKHLHETCYYSY